MRPLPNTTAVAVDYDDQPAANLPALIALGATDVAVNGSFTGSADNWTLGSNWTYGSNAISHSASSSAVASQDVLSDDWYVAQFTISNQTAGAFFVKVGNSLGGTRTSNGTYVEVLNAGTTRTLGLHPSPPFDGTIDDVAAYHLGATQSADQKYRAIERINWSYDTSPTTSVRMTVADNTGIIFSLDVTTAEPLGYVNFGLTPLVASAGSALVVWLDAGGSGVSGKLNVKAR